MSEHVGAVAVLDEAACWQRLAGHELGRLVTRVGEVIDVFPVNYVVDEESVVFRTGEGSKLLELTVNEEVLFEVDDYTPSDAWSVIIRGKARRLENLDEIAEADALPLKPWIPTLKYNFVRIVPSSISGRDFQRGEEPERDGVGRY